MNKSIGAIEFRSISKGIEISDKIVKKAFVEIIYLKSICPGKLLVIVAGDEGDIKESIEYGVEISKGYILDSFIINSVSDAIIDGFKNKYEKGYKVLSIGVVETSKVCSGIKSLDKALKSSDIKLFKLQVAFLVGGKLVYIVSGDLSSVEYGLEEAKKTLNPKEIINISIIPSPDVQIIDNLINNK